LPEAHRLAASRWTVRRLVRAVCREPCVPVAAERPVQELPLERPPVEGAVLSARWVEAAARPSVQRAAEAEQPSAQQAAVAQPDEPRVAAVVRDVQPEARAERDARRGARDARLAEEVAQGVLPVVVALPGARQAEEARDALRAEQVSPAARLSAQPSGPRALRLARRRTMMLRREPEAARVERPRAQSSSAE
jgi:hypothetical protein